MLEDTDIYRKGYPGKRDDLSKEKNWLFYSNSIPYEPNGILIDELHRDWAVDYDTLERRHDYIQWLFPIRESGINWRAQELQLHEAKKIKENKNAKDRVLKSYRIMLGFYGIKSDNEGKLLKYADNWSERASHLNRSRHNHLRITRILKSLGELGFEDLKKPFIDFILKEIFESKLLWYTFESCKNYWIQVLKNDEERNKCLSSLEKYAKGSQEKRSYKKSKRTTYV
ncbi:opioid growth factor receptor-like protein 1 [Anneissia japonica]|uniref:opioid growth factor receptor-like protein 1 n=1 Tax=Anneissia japonica TaxID=1529436 RepID=UPI0014255100|nr:opioid growth factor receptor-like protein 1 [Anneissia japonica]XP_033116649.1 opioid growth factor receptor-like protein 1 [Anneissia japonica]